MNESDNFINVQRRLSAVIAKSEWTSSRMRMQKSGEEFRERRAKTHRTANKFLQELFDKRSDNDLIDDNGAVDRYHKFLKYKSLLNDDTNSTLDEFDRRLRALNNNRQNNQTIKLNNQNLNIIIDKKHQQFQNDLQSTIEIQNDKKDILQQVHYEERSKPSISIIPVTSTPNDTTHELTTHVFHNDEIEDLSNVQEANISFIDNQTNLIESFIHQQNLSPLEKTETLNSSTSSLLNYSLTQTLYAPKALRPDGTEIIVSSSKSPLPHASSNILLFNHCYFPRSLISHGKINTNSTIKRQLPSLPIIQSSEQKQNQHEQFDTNQLYDLLDHLNENSTQFIHNDFTKQLDQLTLSTIIYNNQDQINNNNFSNENIPLINHNNKQEENILPNLFDQSFSSIHKKLFYTIFNINIDDPKNIFLYTMTLSTVQLSASILLPYSILNGRRPLLKCSNQTNFKQIYSKQQKYTYQVTAIESSLNIKHLQQNDIILKINDQSVWGLTIDVIIDIFKKYNQQFDICTLTIARLCQPFI